MTSHWNSLDETVLVRGYNYCLVGKQQQYQRRGNMMYYSFVNCFCRALYLEHWTSLLWCSGVVILFIRYLRTLCIIFKGTNPNTVRKEVTGQTA